MLNTNYFKAVHEETYNGSKYSFIRPIGCPMILFSKVDNSPLASLHLRCTTGALALLTKRPFESAVECHFQGLVNKDNQPFELVITNLNTEGKINFNIIKKDLACINEVNELEPFQSYAIQCDQKDNSTLILSAIIIDDKGTLTVEAAEKVPTKNNGTYLHLSVVPQDCVPSLRNKFKETEWRCVDVFYMQTACAAAKPDFYFRTNNYQEEEEEEEEGGGGGMGIRDSFFEGNRELVVPAVQAHAAPPFSRWAVPAVASAHGKKSNSNSKWSSAAVASADDDDDDNASAHGKKSNSNSKWSSAASASASASPPASPPSIKSPKKPKMEEIIKQSGAASITKGKKIVVKSVESNVEYAYDIASCACTICLSISEEIQFQDEPTLKHWVDTCVDLMVDIRKDSTSSLLGKLEKQYESDHCVICLEDSEIDTIIYQCGHKCMHRKCGLGLKKCPLCRNHIAATIYI